MEKIIPRWEWRTFGETFGEADAKYVALTPGDIQETDELYFLSSANDENVKVRFDLMDIKTLVEVNADGLEQWKPVMKAKFPLPKTEVTKVLVALGAPVPSLARESYTLDQFVTELGEPGGLRAVKVHKKRVRYKVNGCTSEITDVVVDGHKTRTVALELEDADRVIATVREMALGSFPNISYRGGIKRLVGMKG